MGFGERELWQVLGNVIGIGIGIVIDVMLLLMALAFVRRRSVEASNLMAAGAAAMILLSIISPASYMLLARFHGMGEGGIDDYLKLSAIIGIVLSLLRAGSFALVLLGIHRLATAPAPAATASPEPAGGARPG